MPNMVTRSQTKAAAKIAASRPAKKAVAAIPAASLRKQASSTNGAAGPPAPSRRPLTRSQTAKAAAAVVPAALYQGPSQFLVLAEVANNSCGPSYAAVAAGTATGSGSRVKAAPKAKPAVLPKTRGGSKKALASVPAAPAPGPAAPPAALPAAPPAAAPSSGPAASPPHPAARAIAATKGKGKRKANAADVDAADLFLAALSQKPKKRARKAAVPVLAAKKTRGRPRKAPTPAPEAPIVPAVSASPPAALLLAAVPTPVRDTPVVVPIIKGESNTRDEPDMSGIPLFSHVPTENRRAGERAGALTMEKPWRAPRLSTIVEGVDEKTPGRRPTAEEEFVEIKVEEESDLTVEEEEEEYDMVANPMGFRFDSFTAPPNPNRKPITPDISPRTLTAAQQERRQRNGDQFAEMLGPFLAAQEGLGRKRSREEKAEAEDEEDEEEAFDLEEEIARHEEAMDRVWSWMLGVDDHPSDPNNLSSPLGGAQKRRREGESSIEDYSDFSKEGSDSSDEGYKGANCDVVGDLLRALQEDREEEERMAQEKEKEEEEMARYEEEIERYEEEERIERLAMDRVWDWMLDVDDHPSDPNNLSSPIGGAQKRCQEEGSSVGDSSKEGSDSSDERGYKKMKYQVVEDLKRAFQENEEEEDRMSRERKKVRYQ